MLKIDPQMLHWSAYCFYMHIFCDAIPNPAQTRTPDGKVAKSATHWVHLELESIQRGKTSSDFASCYRLNEFTSHNLKAEQISFFEKQRNS